MNQMVILNYQNKTLFKNNKVLIFLLEEEKKKPQLNKNDIKSIKTNNKLNGNHNHK